MAIKVSSEEILGLQFVCKSSQAQFSQSFDSQFACAF